MTDALRFSFASFTVVLVAAAIGSACGGAPPSIADVASTAGAAGPEDRALPATPCGRVTPNALRGIPGARTSGAVALATEGERTIAFVADEDGRSLTAFDVDRGSRLGVTPLEGSPSHILVLGDGRVVATLRDAAAVVVLEPSSGVEAPLVERCRARVASEPIAIAVTRDEGRFVVTSGWGRRLTVLRTSDLAVEASVSLRREPRAVVLDETDQHAFVSHAVGATLSSVDVASQAHDVADIDAHFGTRALFISPPHARSGSQGFALARLVTGAPGGPERARIFAPMVSVDEGQGVHSMATYGPFNGVPVAPVVAVIEETQRRALSNVLGLDDTPKPERACTLPRAAATAGDTLLVACLGIDSVLDLDARARDPMGLERRRFAVPAGPTGIAIDEGRRRAVVWSQFAHALSVLALDEDATTPASTIAAAPRASWPDASTSRGRALFHASNDRRITADARACASCHPDGRDDGLTWQTPTGKHQTIMLAGRMADSGPFGWHGDRNEARLHIGDTWKRLGGRGAWSPADREDLATLSAYVASMRAPSRAGAADELDAELVARGRDLFNGKRQGCATCHPGAHTDGKRHDVKSAPFRLAFDTPSLKGVGGSAPYFHDGRYATLEDLLTKTDGSMGHTNHLDPEERNALIAYLEAQ